MVANQNGQQVAAWGSMPASLPVQKRILRAELWAILQALRHCSPPIQIHTDCAAVVQGLKRGSKQCGAAGAKHADVWRMIWHHIDDIGIGEYGIQILKCKAHMTEAAIQRTEREQQKVAYLNKAADGWAKQGAETDHPVEWHVQALNDQQTKIRGIMKYLAYIEVNTRDVNGDRSDAQKKSEKVKKIGKRRRGRPPGKHRPLGHARWEGQEWKPHVHAYDKGVAKQDERGTLGHVIWRTGAWTWCHRCGLRSKHKVLGLKKRCRTTFVNSQAKVRRDRLKQGRHPCGDEALGTNAHPLKRIWGKQPQ